MKEITLIHFNDVYNVDKAARFVHQVNQVQQQTAGDDDSSCTFFSGDAFSPSLLSTTLRGKQMIPVLKALHIDCACLGNHDLDFGVSEFSELRDECGFPWICSNARNHASQNSHHPKNNEPQQQLAGCEEYIVLEKNGNRLLVLGLIEASWMATLSTIDPEMIEFEEPTDYVQRRVPELVQEYGPFDMVIATSHMRMPSDYKLADDCAGQIDIILGGHDHHYEDTIRNGIRILNSGTDFSDFTAVHVKGREDSSLDAPNGRFHPLQTVSTRYQIHNDMLEDPKIAAAVIALQSNVQNSMNRVIGTSQVDLDARFSQIRTKETNISNFLASVMARATDADVALLNSGSIRADRIIPKGDIKMSDLADLVPMDDSMEVVEITGEQLLQVLENGVSQYPAMEGRFPCVDGIRFAFDPSQAAGSRIVDGSVTVRSRQSFSRLYKKGDTPPTLSNNNTSPVSFCPLELQRTYTFCTKTYLLKGKDGYDVLADCKVVREEEYCPLLPTAVANLFTQIGILQRWTDYTTQGSVIAAATKFKQKLRSSIGDPFAINPVVDGRIRNILESEE